MGKTCRTCADAIAMLDCYYQGDVSRDCAELCSHWQQRETPLLVDELAKTLRSTLSYLHIVKSVSNPSGIFEMIRRVANVLAQHQKEVDDD